MSEELIGILTVNGGLVLIALMVITIVVKVFLVVCLFLIYLIKHLFILIPSKIREYFYRRKSVVKKLLIITVFLVVAKASYNIYNIEDNLTTEEKIKIMFMDAHSTETLFKKKGVEVISDEQGFAGYQIFYIKYYLDGYGYKFKFWPENITFSIDNPNENKYVFELEIDKNNYIVKTNDAGYSAESIEKLKKK